MDNSRETKTDNDETENSQTNEEEPTETAEYKIVTIKKRTMKGWMTYKIKRYKNVDYSALSNTPNGRCYMSKIAAHIKMANIDRKKMMLDFIRYIRLLNDNELSQLAYGIVQDDKKNEPL